MIGFIVLIRMIYCTLCTNIRNYKQNLLEQSSHTPLYWPHKHPMITLSRSDKCAQVTPPCTSHSTDKGGVLPAAVPASQFSAKRLTHSLFGQHLVKGEGVVCNILDYH